MRKAGLVFHKPCFFNCYSAKNKLYFKSDFFASKSNPTCSELACGELVEPVEGVEPISKGIPYCSEERQLQGL
jgi:hypothetical protein